jgi:uncharacterized protein
MQEVLFIQGAGEGAYKEDKRLVTSLQQALGSEYNVRYPAMPDEDNAPYDQWKQQIETALATMAEPIILAGHSVGASILIKYISENAMKKRIGGLFLMATPFWGGEGWHYEGYEALELPKGGGSRVPQDAAVFLYHCRDDETVPFDHLALYAQVLPQATVREIDQGGHQLNNDLSEVAKDIHNLSQ